MISDETKNKWKRKTNAIIEACDLGRIELNNWEEEFMDSISILVSEDMELSFKQSSTLNSIYERIR